MVDALRLYAAMLAVSVRSQLQYRVNFLLSAAGQFFATGIEVVGIWALFERFERLGAWTLPEVALFYGVVNVAFAIADALGAGFDQFDSQVRQGDFDRVLLRPRGTVLQLLGQELAIRRVGRLAQGGLVLAYAAWALPIAWGAAEVGLILGAVAGGACLFLALFVVRAAIAFWTVESLEAINAFSYGGVFAAQYPITIYAPWFRWFFTFIVPLACVTYFPLTLVLGKEDPLGWPAWLRAAAPAAGVGFLGLSFVAWRVGVRKYTSTGS